MYEDQVFLAKVCLRGGSVCIERMLVPVPPAPRLCCSTAVHAQHQAKRYAFLNWLRGMRQKDASRKLSSGKRCKALWPTGTRLLRLKGYATYFCESMKSLWPGVMFEKRVRS
jgi:hypothetical protein